MRIPRLVIVSGLFVGMSQLPPAGAAPLSSVFQIHGEPTEISAIVNGSAVTPALAPPGFTGSVVLRSGGSVNFAPAQTGNGVFFANCCSNTADAYYKFGGSAVGSIFNGSQGQVSFVLRSRYSFAQR